jgi:hypothetical protein
VGIAVVSVLPAVFGGEWGPFWAGQAFWAVGPALYIHCVFSGRRRKRVQEALALG